MKIRLQDHGIFWLAQPRDAATAPWLSNAASDDAMWFGPEQLVEWRFINDLMNAAREAGVLQTCCRPRTSKPITSMREFCTRDSCRACRCRILS